MKREDLIGHTFPIGTDGHIRLVDVMGTDRAIAEAAWVSTEAENPGQDRSDAEVSRVLRYMMRKRHTSPFEMAELKFKIRIPMDAWRQMIRHRTANVNEYSTRYTEAIDSRAITHPDRWRGQSDVNHQGSEGWLPREVGLELSQEELDFHARAMHVYRRRLQKGVAREQARKDLPLSTYTEAFWKTDLHNLLHYLELRMDPHAQLEIRTFAETIGLQIVAPLFPISWDAFMDYRFRAVTFSAMEMEAIWTMLEGKDMLSDDSLVQLGLGKGERREFLEKIRGYGHA